VNPLPPELCNNAYRKPVAAENGEKMSPFIRTQQQGCAPQGLYDLSLFILTDIL